MQSRGFLVLYYSVRLVGASFSVIITDIQGGLSDESQTVGQANVRKMQGYSPQRQCNGYLLRPQAQAKAGLIFGSAFALAFLLFLDITCTCEGGCFRLLRKFFAPRVIYIQ